MLRDRSKCLDTWPTLLMVHVHVFRLAADASVPGTARLLQWRAEERWACEEALLEYSNVTDLVLRYSFRASSPRKEKSS